MNKVRVSMALVVRDKEFDVYNDLGIPKDQEHSEEDIKRVIQEQWKEDFKLFIEDNFGINFALKEPATLTLTVKFLEWS